MTDAIGRGDYVLGADFSELEKRLAAAEETIKASGAEAEKTFADAGKKAGEKFGGALKLAAKVATSVAALGFAVATKGAVELENATASFRAETGATAEEAKRAGNAILGMSSKNIAPLEEIGEALTKVHTDLGLVGKEAEDATQLFLTFARATKQDAAAAVMAFDDILDSWGLTAKDAGRIMDLLVASHQKYGGSIEANQSALAALGPALRAANLQLADGQALLNLFAASGLDAAEAPAALTKALANIKSPAELRRLIDEISQTDDAFVRSQKAADLFGVKAGAKLANALAGTNLDDFRLSLTEVAGASDRAAAALDSTFSARLQLMLKAVGAQVTGFAAALGPAVSATAALATGAAALGLNVAGAIPALRLFITTLGAVRLAIIATGIGALVVGIGALAAVAMDARPEIEKLKEALNAKVPILGWDVLPEAAKNDIVRRISEIELAQSKQLEATQAWVTGVRQKVEQSGIPAAVGALTAAMAAEVASGRAVLETDANGLTSIIPKAVADAKAKAERIARQVPGDIAKALRAGQDEVTSGMAALKDAMANQMTAAARIAGLRGLLAGKELAAGLKSSDPYVRAQAEALKASTLAQIAAIEEAAEGYGLRTGGELARGLRLSIGSITAAARAAAGAARRILQASSPPGPESPLHDIALWGERTFDAYADGIRRAAGSIRSAAVDALSAMPAFGPGVLVGSLAASSHSMMTVNVRHTIDAAGAQALRSAGFDENRVAGALSAGVDLSGLLAEVRQRVALRPG